MIEFLFAAVIFFAVVALVHLARLYLEKDE